MTSKEEALERLILAGIVGSTAYGLAGPDSDVDRLGVYAAPTIQFHGLRPPTGKQASVVVTDPSDATYHEAGKLASLCLGGNPTVMELLWLPEYEVITALGKDLINIRNSFLSAKRVRNAYLGYATDQFKLLERRGDGSFSSDTRKRTAKHARHLMRLCHQGFILYSSGRLVIRLENPQAFKDFGESVSSGDIQLARDLILTYEEKFNDTETVLPDKPDEAVVEKWLHKVRAVNL
jgi:predicted nucleotidyltransferase